jgi:hypothetical protein
VTTSVDALQAKWLYTFTPSETMAAEKRWDIVLKAALKRLKQKERIANPRRWRVIPNETEEVEF